MPVRDPFVAAASASLLAAGATALAFRARHARRDGRPRRTAVTLAVAVALVVAAAGAVRRGIDLTRLTPRRCNGYAALCDRRYDQVTFAGAHNAMASADRHFLSVMQDLTIGGQLRSGVRALLVDAHYRDPGPGTARGGAWWCHMTCRLGAERLADGFREVRDFLDHHPDEVVTIIVEDHVARADVAAGVRRSGLDRYVFTPGADPRFVWPTLGRMITDDRRVVIFSERTRALTAPRWFRNFYRYGMETPFADRSVAQEATDCRPNRGGTGKELFLLNHFVTAGTGSRVDATRMNDERFLLRRAEQCARVRGHRVNIVAVDFTTIGGLIPAVAALNGVGGTPGRSPG